MKELNISYREALWGIPYPIIMRILSDLPRQVKKNPNEVELTEQTVDQFKQFVEQTNQQLQK